MFYRSQTENHALRLRRARPVIAMASVAFAIGAIVGANHTSSSAHTVAQSFVHAWTRGEYARMYSDVDAAARPASIVGFADAYRKEERTATATSMVLAGRPRSLPGDEVAVPVRVRTRLFGTLALAFRVKILTGGGEGTRVAWSSSALFPGLRPRERLSRRTT